MAAVTLNFHDVDPTKPGRVIVRGAIASNVDLPLPEAMELLPKLGAGYNAKGWAGRVLATKRVIPLGTDRFMRVELEYDRIPEVVP